MPVQIGGKRESNFGDPIGLLMDCHRRIERFLSVLVEVSGRDSLNAEERTSLETALRYFREAAPKHTSDEEETLFPRMRSLGQPEVQAVLAKVERLETDHASAARNHEEVDRLGRAWLENGTLAPDDAVRFRALVLQLADLYREHIAVEEREVFPAAAAAFDRETTRAMGGEMQARRGIR